MDIVHYCIFHRGNVNIRAQHSGPNFRLATSGPSYNVTQYDVSSPSIISNHLIWMDVSESTMLGSLFCGTIFHVAWEGQFHINVYTVLREKGGGGGGGMKRICYDLILSEFKFLFVKFQVIYLHHWLGSKCVKCFNLF